MQITPLDILTSGGAHPDREQSPECTSEVRKNAGILAEPVSNLLDYLGIKNAKVSSGFRTIKANAEAGGSHNSKHLIGAAVDILDPDNAIDKAITDEALEKFSLYREHPTKTLGWVHLTWWMPLSGRRTFFP